MQLSYDLIFECFSLHVHLDLKTIPRESLFLLIISAGHFYKLLLGKQKVSEFV
jgi:hypothetical protein